MATVALPLAGADEIWFQSDSPVVKISTMSKLVQVFLYNLGGGFREIRKVGYRFLSRLMPQHVMDFLVEVGEAGSPCGLPVAAAPVRIAEPSVPDAKMEMDNLEFHSDYAASSRSSSNCQEGAECIPDTQEVDVPVTSFLHRLQFHGWRMCPAFFSNLT
ncbi:hypothetical protein PIB30_048555 [Stylosanthes scabra]|uniref:Uncharacterized protein n=1 Tax=Stylosanthes scabra TaxID=79078 RepID=A0ABU6TGR7_9FABA|nr:hypothetical protein [Stylosanthes scabra]